LEKHDLTKLSFVRLESVDRARGPMAWVSAEIRERVIGWAGQDLSCSPCGTTTNFLLKSQFFLAQDFNLGRKKYIPEKVKIT
jgi:hypothetical protein